MPHYALGRAINHKGLTMTTTLPILLEVLPLLSVLVALSGLLYVTFTSIYNRH